MQCSIVHIRKVEGRSPRRAPARTGFEPPRAHLGPYGWLAGAAVGSTVGRSGELPPDRRPYGSTPLWKKKRADPIAGIKPGDYRNHLPER